jgi:hypothetical protein
LGIRSHRLKHISARNIFHDDRKCFNNIRYGLVARISRSHTVFFATQLGPRRPGFNSPCRKSSIAFAPCLATRSVGCDETKKSFFRCTKIMIFCAEAARFAVETFLRETWRSGCDRKQEFSKVEGCFVATWTCYLVVDTSER